MFYDIWSDVVAQQKHFLTHNTEGEAVIVFVPVSAHPVVFDWQNISGQILMSLTEGMYSLINLDVSATQDDRQS